MKILVVFTGGTIGSTLDSSGYIKKDNNKAYVLLSKFEKEYNGLYIAASFETCEPYSLLSENLNGSHLLKLGELIKSKLSGYDGIIITHGSDTLQYTAAFLNYYLGAIDIPVLLVASNYVLEDKRACGLYNFAAAVNYIETKKTPGVYVPYPESAYTTIDANTTIKMHKANLLLPHLPLDDMLYSMPDASSYTHEANSIDTNADAFTNACEDNFIDNNSNCGSNNLAYPREISEIIKGFNPDFTIRFKASASSDVLRIFSYPGMAYPEIPKNTKAVLIDTYHSGTLCSNALNIKSFAENARALSIPVFVTGCNKGADYDSVKEWADYGFILLPELSPISAYMLLWMYI